MSMGKIFRPLEEVALGKKPLLALAAVFLTSAAAWSFPQPQAALADLYRKGSIKFAPAAAVDEATLPKDVFLQQVTDVREDSRSNVYVCDSRASSVFKFDPAGKFLKSIGRKGQGPGEFNLPFKIAVTSDRLFVYDLMNRRLCALTLEGEFIKSVPLVTGEGRPEGMSALPNGDLVMGWETIHYEDETKPQDYETRVYAPDLSLRKTLSKHAIWRNKYMQIEGFGRRTNIIQPFSPLVSWGVTPDGKVVVGFQKEYAIDLYDPARGKIASFTHASEPVAVTDKDKEAFFASLTFGYSDSSGNMGTVQKGTPEPIMKATEFPKVKPAFFDLLADSDGNILVFPHRKTRDEEGRVFDAFTPEGKFIGTVKVEGPEGMPRDTVVRNGSFWATQTDAEGNVRVIKRKISG